MQLISLAAITTFANSCSILGICLGHQAIAQNYGYKITKAPIQMHDKIDEIVHDKKGLFTGIKNPLNVVRYHLLVAYDNFLVNSIPMVITAKNKQGATTIKHYP